MSSSPWVEDGRAVDYALEHIRLAQGGQETCAGRCGERFLHREPEVGMFEHHRPESLWSEILEERQKGVGGDA